MNDSSSTHHRLGDLQLRILKVLWSVPEASVADVHGRLQSTQPLAYTTVATLLRRMEARGLVAHREQGRSFVYRATVEASEVGASLGHRMVEQVFEGSLTDAVSHLLRTRDVRREELDALEKLIREAKRRTR